jgi:ketosteroid isomerase-like protein
MPGGGPHTTHPANNETATIASRCSARNRDRAPDHTKVLQNNLTERAPAAKPPVISLPRPDGDRYTPLDHPRLPSRVPLRDFNSDGSIGKGWPPQQGSAWLGLPSRQARHLRRLRRRERTPKPNARGATWGDTSGSWGLPGGEQRCRANASAITSSRSTTSKSSTASPGGPGRRRDSDRSLRSTPAGGRFRDEELHLWTLGADGRIVRLRHYVDTAKHIAAAAGNDTTSSA